jgi:ABC-type glutathione transport system ATPase component
MAKTVLELRHIDVVRDGTAVLRDVSFEAASRHVVVVIGEEGAGKSTLLRCIGLDFAPTSGRVLLDGVDVTGTSGEARRQLRSRRIELVHPPAPDGVVDHTVPSERSGMLLANAAPGTVPVAGMRQRIQIAKALTAGYRLLLLDEPFVGVDSDARGRIFDLLYRLRSETEVAVVVASRSIEVAGALADTVVVLREGEVVETGSAARVLSSPAHSYTRSLLAQRRSA